MNKKNKEIFDWCDKWFDNKRYSNEMWRMNQDELNSLFLKELKEFLK